MAFSECSISPPLRNSGISRAVLIHRSEIAESHAQEPSTTQESQNLTRRNVPPLGNSRILRAGAVHRSGIAEFHAQESSTAQESQFFTRRMVPLYTNSD